MSTHKSTEPTGWHLPLRSQLTRFGVRLSHPFVFVVVAVYGLGWYVFEPSTFNWHAVATMATWFMTLFIQRAAHRDTQAVHAKLDELLKAVSGARTELSRIDASEPEEITRHRRQSHASLNELVSDPEESR